MIILEKNQLLCSSFKMAEYQMLPIICAMKWVVNPVKRSDGITNSVNTDLTAPEERSDLG